MPSVESCELDRTTAQAWALFRSRLADHVAAMSGESTLQVDVESRSGADDDRPGVAPYVRFCAWGNERVRCEVPGNSTLAAQFTLSAADIGTLESLGYHAAALVRNPDGADSRPTDYELELERRHADRLAVMAVKVLQEVFGVPHPAFLRAGSLLAPLDHSVSGLRPAPEPDAVAAEAVAVVPRDPAHLRELVDLALTPSFGHPPRHDSGGDVPVVSGVSLVLVCVHQTLPVIELFSTLIRDVDDKAEAAEVVAGLNRDINMIKFTLQGTSVLAAVQLPSMPFAPLHLRNMLAYMSKVADEVGNDLADRFGGQRGFDTPGAEETEADRV